MGRARRAAPQSEVADMATLTRRRATRPDRPVMSLVIPVRNEASTLESFMEATTPVLDELAADAELVFVNDGSEDGTLSLLFDLQDHDPRVRIVNLSRNFGKEAALSAGLAAAGGDVIVPIDADLQDPPQLLGPFLQHWRDGYDVVHGLRVSRRGDSLPVRVSALGFYRVFNALSQTRMPQNVGDFRLMDRRVVDAVLSLTERNRVMKGMFSWVGFPSIEVEYERPGRCAGSTGWTMRRRWRLALDAITSFSTAPLRIWTYLGMVVAAAAGIYGMVILAIAMAGGTSHVPGYASLILVTLFLGSMQLLSLGLLGEYLSRVLIETKGRPLYLIEGVYTSGVDLSDETVDPVDDPQVISLPAPRRIERTRPEATALERRAPHG